MITYHSNCLFGNRQFANCNFFFNSYRIYWFPNDSEDSNTTATRVVHFINRVNYARGIKGYAKQKPLGIYYNSK